MVSDMNHPRDYGIARLQTVGIDRSPAMRSTSWFVAKGECVRCGSVAFDGSLLVILQDTSCDCTQRRSISVSISAAPSVRDVTCHFVLSIQLFSFPSIEGHPTAQLHWWGRIAARPAAKGCPEYYQSYERSCARHHPYCCRGLALCSLEL